MPHSLLGRFKAYFKSKFWRALTLTFSIQVQIPAEVCLKDVISFTLIHFVLLKCEVEGPTVLKLSLSDTNYPFIHTLTKCNSL